MDRIKKICSYLDKCTTFADVGCDHGYCTRYMLENGYCKKAIISDISAKCLKKAEILLENYKTGGVLTSVCCNGLELVDGSTEQILIAGMGGDEIVGIMKSGFIPQKFVLQPMKNARKVREFLIENSAEISTDEVFKCGDKFYFIIKGKRSGVKTRYSRANLEFGRELDSKEIKEYIALELEKIKARLCSAMKLEARECMEEKIRFYEEVLNGETC